MKKIGLDTQYNQQAQEYNSKIADYNKESRELFLTLMPDIRGKNVLDLACADGTDAKTYTTLGANVTGIDSSKEMIRIAKQQVPQATFLEARMESLPLQQEYDVVTCKYAMQTSRDINKIYEEITKVLKPEGTLLILITHPFRQFMEKSGKEKDYFKQEIVRSTIFEDAIELHEPSHTFNEYFSPYFLVNYDLQYYLEREEFPAVKRMHGHNYPCYSIIKAIKRGEKQ